MSQFTITGVSSSASIPVSQSYEVGSSNHERTRIEAAGKEDDEMCELSNSKEPEEIYTMHGLHPTIKNGFKLENAESFNYQHWRETFIDILYTSNTTDDSPESEKEKEKEKYFNILWNMIRSFPCNANKTTSNAYVTYVFITCIQEIDTLPVVVKFKQDPAQLSDEENDPQAHKNQEYSKWGSMKKTTKHSFLRCLMRRLHPSLYKHWSSLWGNFISKLDVKLSNANSSSSEILNSRSLQSTAPVHFTALVAHIAIDPELKILIAECEGNVVNDTGRHGNIEVHETGGFGKFKDAKKEELATAVRLRQSHYTNPFLENSIPYTVKGKGLEEDKTEIMEKPFSEIDPQHAVINTGEQLFTAMRELKTAVGNVSRNYEVSGNSNI